MVKVTGPVLSLAAQKSLGKKMTFQNRPSGSACYLYKKPGDRIAFNPSWKQKNQRGIYGLIISRWQGMTPAEKLQWDGDAKNAGISGSGFHYFCSLAQTNLYYYLGLSVYLPFNEGTGCRTLDISGNGNHGNLLPTCPTNSPLWITGQNTKYGNAVKFDGSDDYIDIGNNTTLDIENKYTIEFWIYPLSLTNRLSVFSIRKGAAAGGFALEIGPGSGGSNCLAATIPGIFTMQTANNSLLVGKWQHVVWTKSAIAGPQAVWVNSVKQTLVTDNSQTQKKNTDTKLIGKTNLASDSLSAYLDEFRIFNRPISDVEILKHYEMFRIN